MMPSKLADDIKEKTVIAVMKSMLKWDKPVEYRIKFIMKNGKTHIKEVKTKSDLAIELNDLLDMNQNIKCEITKILPQHIDPTVSKN